MSSREDLESELRRLRREIGPIALKDPRAARHGLERSYEIAKLLELPGEASALLAVMARGAAKAEPLRALQTARRLVGEFPDKEGSWSTLASVLETLANHFARRGNLLRASSLADSAAVAHRRCAELGAARSIELSRSLAKRAEDIATEWREIWKRRAEGIEAPESG